MRPTPHRGFSIVSVCSLLSALALGSFFSISSIGSIVGVLSIGSITSFLSIASLNSALSIASTQCTLKIGTDCTNEPAHSFDLALDFGGNAWRELSKCTFAQYKSDNRPSWCDYQPVTLTLHGEVYPCEARRKGSSTWQDDATNKPSWKVKCETEHTWALQNCTAMGVACPAGQTTNTWRSKKIVLNNNGNIGSHFSTYHWVKNAYHTWGEVPAYEVFRDIGVTAVPQAYWARLQVRVDGQEVSSHGHYVALENVDDKAFAAKWFGRLYALFEVESGTYELERDKGIQCSNKSHCMLDDKQVSIPNLVNDTSLGMFPSSLDNMLLYYIGELIVGHWDGACTRTNPNNHWYAYDTKNWYPIPYGLDNTFQGCIYDLTASEEPQCASMKQCFAEETCKARFHHLYSIARGKAARSTDSCASDLMWPIVYLCVGLVAPLALSIAFARCIVPLLLPEQRPGTFGAHV